MCPGLRPPSTTRPAALEAPLGGPAGPQVPVLRRGFELLPPGAASQHQDKSPEPMDDLYIYVFFFFGSLELQM